MKWIRRRLFEWAYRDGQVGQCDGIALAEVYHDAQFVSTIAAALKLIESVDPRRFARIKGRIKWIVNARLLREGGRYDPYGRACVIDFSHVSEWVRPWAVGTCARLLVHLATQAVILDCGVAYTRQNRSRFARLCIQEEQRFVARLAHFQPEVANFLTREFTEDDWTLSWNPSWTDKLGYVWSQVAESARRAWAELAEPIVRKYRHS